MIDLELLDKNMKLKGLTLLKDISEYGDINTHTKMHFIDNDGYKYYLSQQNICVCIRRNGVLAKFFNKNPYTYENINNCLLLDNKNIRLVDISVEKASMPVYFKCLIHGELILRSWNSVTSGNCSCSKCTGRNVYKLEDVKKIVASYGCKFLSTEYDMVHKEYSFECSCGDEFKRRFDVFLYQGVRVCNKCNGININTLESVRGELLNHNIELLSNEFKNITSNIHIKYNCGFKTERTLSNIRRGDYKCPHCSKKGYKRTTQMLNEEVKKLVGDEYKFYGEYEICDKKMKIIHNKCGFEYEVTPHRFINGGNRCPICNQSKNEETINNWLQCNGFKFKREYSFDGLLGIKGKPLRFDFAILNENNNICLLIEYDGEYHYKPIEGCEKLKIQQEHDNRKDIYCSDNNIELLRIPYWESCSIESILYKKLKEEN